MSTKVRGCFLARVGMLIAYFKMAETAREDLLEIMRDRKIGLRARLRAAIAAMRVESVRLPDEPTPEAAVFLRSVLDMEISGTRLEPELRIEAGGALAYYEKRVSVAALRAEGGVLIAGSDDDDGAPAVYRDGERYAGLAANMDWHNKRTKAQR